MWFKLEKRKEKTWLFKSDKSRAPFPDQGVLVWNLLEIMIITIEGGVDRVISISNVVPFGRFGRALCQILFEELFDFYVKHGCFRGVILRDL